MKSVVTMSRSWRHAAPLRVATVFLLPMAILLSIAPNPLSGQEASTVNGLIRDAEGHPLAGADVFLLETLEGTPTDDAGSFSFATGATGTVTLVVQLRGYIEVRRAVHLPRTSPLSLVMQLAPVPLEPILVEAGTFRLGRLPDVALDELEVVGTPGAAADPFRAIQTFPGLQNVGEGAGLFVRGGDVSETRVLLDGATVLSPFRLDGDRSVSFGRFDPFLLRGINFSAGGFGAEYGDALSAVADLETVDRPEARQIGLTASIGGASSRVDLALSETFGGFLTGTYTNTDLLMRLNGRRPEFDVVPRSDDLSGGFQWAYRDGGSLKTFAMRQTDEIGVRIADPGYSGVYRSDGGADLVIVSGLDGFGSLGLSWGLATSGSRKSEDFGAFRLERADRLMQARAKVEVPVSRGFSLAGGAEVEHRGADLAGAVAVASHDNAPDAPKTIFSSCESGTRLAGFGEIELQPSNALRLLLGARADRSSFTGRVTGDPRISATWRAAEYLTFTAAWGVFHQVPDPLLFEPTLGDPTLPSMSARHVIGGITYDNGARFIRAEAYHKRYRSLAAQNRDGLTRGRGIGDARGFDIFLKEELGLLGLSGRMAYSFVDSNRTDPDSGRLVPSPFDATHTFNVVVTREFSQWLQTGVAYRAATGTPFTPVESAVFDPARAVWEPVFGAPMSERVPEYSRLDLSATVLWSFRPDNLTVFFVSAMNVLDRTNVSQYRYSSDYSERIPLKSPFPRTIYFGVTTTLPF